MTCCVWCPSWGFSTAPVLWIWTVSLRIASFSYGIPDGFLLDELVAFLQKVASEAPEVPFYYYHIPPLTGVKSKYRSLVICSGQQVIWCFWMHGFIFSLKCVVAGSFLKFFWSGKRVLLFVVLRIVLELYSLIGLGWKWTSCKIRSLSLGDKAGNSPRTGLPSLIWDCCSAQFVWKSCWMG